MLNAADKVAAPRSRSGWGSSDIPRLSCTLPEALAAVRTGESVWFDDGKVGAIVRAVREHEVEVEITWARGGQSPSDVRDLLLRLRALGAEHVGVVLKIETRRGFEALPELLLAAMQDRAVGVMIARGDLAVECGWEQLAEIQEQILWLCEAAHAPVIWATQVLESLAKTGRPSRAEITDATMGERAECVMLNEGPHVVEAIRVLDRILERMAGHQSKRSPRLPKLRAWQHYAGLAPAWPAVHGPVVGDPVPEAVAAGTSRIESISE
jgi:pyruvate kinase